MTDAYFHKLLLAEGNRIPITSVIKDENDQKHKYKFRYIDMDDDFTEPSDIEPDVYHIDIHSPPREYLEAAARGINTHTEYNAKLRDK